MASTSNMVPPPLHIRNANGLTMQRTFLLDASKATIFRRSSNNSTSPSTASSPATRRPDRPGMNAFTTPSNEPSPVYSATAPTGHTTQSTSSSSSTPNTTAPITRTPSTPITTSDNDPYAFLSTSDTKFLIDDSGSMAGRSWRESAAALSSIAPICTAHDADGIDIHFLNTPDNARFNNVTDASTVREIFSMVRPHAGTPMGERIDALLRPYLQQVKNATVTPPKPLNLIVITDGVPNDDVESVLIAAAKKLDALDAKPWQVGVQFFQVGQEEGAGQYLASLDDELSRMGGGCRDIVDTVPYDATAPLSGEAMLKVVLGAVNRRIDRRKNA